MAYPITWAISAVIYIIYFSRVDWVHGFEDAKKPIEKTKELTNE